MSTFILALLLVSFATSIDTSLAESAYDGLRIFYAENITDIQVDEMNTDRIYVSAGSYLYGLNGNLDLEEIRSLTSQSVNISLSSDGRRLVVCMTDLSCEIYNAANLSNGPIARRPNAIISAKNMALFATDDRFYVGSISGAQQQIFLNWYAYSGNQRGSGTYCINRDGFERRFYGGFVKGSNAYYFATDNINKPLNDDDRLRNFKVMRVCNSSSSSIGALYELSLGCDSLRPGADTRISGISVVEDFAGIPGTTIILSRSRPKSTQNFVCIYSLQMIDTMMQRKFDSCSTSQLDSTETIKLAWRNPSIYCTTAFQVLHSIH